MKKGVGILFLLVIFLGVIFVSANEVYCTTSVPGAPKPCSAISSTFPTIGNPKNPIYEVPYANGPGEPTPPLCAPYQDTSCNATTSCTTNLVDMINNIGDQPISGTDVCRLNKTGIVTAICANLNTSYFPTWVYNWYEVNEFTSLKNTTYAEGVYPAQCTDKIDNDCDGSIDGNESTCGGPLETICDDHKDNDGNGLTDCDEAYCVNDPYCTGCALNQEICYDGIDNNCNGESDWDTQVWDGFYPTGIPKTTKGDINCKVDVYSVYSIPVSPLENSNVQVYCNTSVDMQAISLIGVDSVNVYIDFVKCTPNTIQGAWQGSTGIFDCPTGSAGNKTLKCEVNTFKSYSNNATITPNIIVQSTPQEVSCQPASSCSDYTTQTSCQNDCNNAWTNDQPDNLICGTDSCSSGSTWNSCGCVWNASAPTPCGFAYSPDNQCGTCGNGFIEAGEECDPNGPGSADDNITISCSDVGSSCGGNVISCTNSCKIDASECTGCGPGTCGDGAKNDQELCEGNNLGGKTCASFNLASGTLGCFSSTQTNSCHFDTSRCVNITGTGWCSIGNESITKECDVDPMGFRQFQWTGTWYGNVNPPQQSQCQDNLFSKMVLCPSQFRLPFFQGYSFAIAGLAIALTYYFLIRKKKIVFV
ncbi:MAG: hypothetical protein AABW51_02850 [Nanoarchaeota archaeon]